MKSFLQGKKVLPSVSPLRAPAALTTRPTSRACADKVDSQSGQPSAPSNATVQLIKEGDKVVRMIVMCSCGERVEIECLYPAGM